MTAGPGDFLASVFMRFSSCDSISRIFAIAPSLLSDRQQRRDLYSRLGQSRGGFVLKFPKDWAASVTRGASASVSPTEDDLYEVACLLQSLQDTNSLVAPPLTAARETEDWLNGLKVLLKARPDLDGKLTKIVSNDHHDVNRHFYSLAKLKPREIEHYLHTPTDNSPPKGERWTVSDLVDNLEIYAQQSEILAIVDRYPLFQRGKFSLQFLELLLRRTQGSHLHELVIYNSAEEFGRGWTGSSDQIATRLRDALNWSGRQDGATFEKEIIPRGGIRYLLVKENSSDSDLHMRSFVTKFVDIQLSTSLNNFGISKSQRIDRSTNSRVVEDQVARWIDGQHGLQIAHALHINRNGTISKLR